MLISLLVPLVIRGNQLPTIKGGKKHKLNWILIRILFLFRIKPKYLTYFKMFSKVVPNISASAERKETASASSPPRSHILTYCWV